MPLLPHGIRCITFDAAGTLIFPHPGVGEVYGEVLRAHGIDAPALELDRRFKRVFGELTARPRPRTDAGMERAFWRRVVAETVAPWCPDDLVDAVFLGAFAAFARGSAWRAAPDAAPTLAALRRRGLRLAVLSNADSRFLQVFADLGLAPFFEHIFLSGEVGWEKPDRRAFDNAAGVLRAAPEELLHVGDDPAIDGEGARRAGWRALILDRDIRSLSELAEGGAEKE